MKKLIVVLICVVIVSISLFVSYPNLIDYSENYDLKKHMPNLEKDIASMTLDDCKQIFDGVTDFEVFIPDVVDRCFNVLNYVHTTVTGIETPANFTATSGDTQVELNWTALPSSDGNSNTNYYLEYKPSTVPWNSTKSVVSVMGTWPPETIAGLTNGQSYDFRITTIPEGPTINSDNIDYSAFSTVSATPNDAPKTKNIDKDKQVQRIMENCNIVDEPRPEILIRYSNDTHVIDNIACGWYEKVNHIPVTKNLENKVLEKLQQEPAYITFYDSYPNANETTYYNEETGTSSITLDVKNSKIVII